MFKASVILHINMVVLNIYVVVGKMVLECKQVLEETKHMLMCPNKVFKTLLLELR